jgi:hypothetical protein
MYVDGLNLRKFVGTYQSPLISRHSMNLSKEEAWQNKVVRRSRPLVSLAKAGASALDSYSACWNGTHATASSPRVGHTGLLACLLEVRSHVKVADTCQSHSVHELMLSRT